MKTTLKSLFILLVVFIACTSFNKANSSNSLTLIQENQTEEISTCKYGHCQATAKSTGNRCKHCVSNKGDKYCWQHR